MLDIILYHKTCYQKFTTDGIAIKRAREKEKILKTPKSSRISHRRLSRSVVKTFDDQKYLFCQNNDGMGHLHECMMEARDLTLKKVFQNCSESLALYKIRYERVLDACAGDIKYHTSCWVEHIDCRVKDFAEISDNVTSVVVDNENNGTEVYPSTQEEYEKDKTLENENNTIIAVAMHETIHDVEISLENNGILSLHDKSLQNEDWVVMVKIIECINK